jgi:hypothetical protein
MNRSLTLATLYLVVVALVAPALRADVKTTEKTTLKLEGMLGKLIGGAAKDGIVSREALKGARKLSMNDKTGEIKAVMGEEGAAAMQQLAAVFAMFGSAKPMMEKMQTEGRKLDGTPLHSTVVMESVKSAEQMKAAASQQQSSGGGMSGMLARKMMGGPPKQRSTVMTTSTEMLTVATSATAEDAAIPVGFKEKK